ncbi:MAG: Tetratricopeptide (TPR) repeat [Pelagibacterales bacterium]|jgi:tetratricopeptide (TPR) repeat protein|nr:Tetratricopeptide (TPR) repeat [Pelagibacterales bacterium]
MNLFKFSFKLTVQILFVTIFFSTLQAKNLDKFNDGDNISDYFSGILLLNDNQYEESYKFLKKLNGLEENHLNYSSKYLYTLVNLGKINEAFNYAKKLEKRKLDNFESDLIIGVYYLRDDQLKLAQKYFLKLKNRNPKSIINNFVSNSLLNWSSFSELNLNNAQNKINLTDPRFENLKKIQNVFLHCYYKSQKTEFFFKNLTSNTEIDFSRYNYFYAKYLVSEGKIDQGKQVLNSSLESYPKNLLLNQYKFDLSNDVNENNFNCQNLSHVTAEILYITANALSSQSIYTFSNFYLNLAKYLNTSFYSFNALRAENFYETNNLKEAKKSYNDVGKQGATFVWYAAKQNSKILIKENQKEKALKLLTKSYEKLPEKNIYETLEYANFLKNNEQFENSIKYYNKITKKIKKNHPLYPEVMDGRGIAHDRMGNWEKAEKDLLASLEASPDQAYVINYLAYSWIEKGVKIEKSLKMLEKANNLKSNDPYIIDSLGWVLFKLKKYKDAKKHLQMAVRLMPADPIVNDHYGDVLWKNGNKMQARYYWNYVLNLEETKEELKVNIKNKLILGL